MALCANCGLVDVQVRRECPACRIYRFRHGEPRPRALAEKRNDLRITQELVERNALSPPNQTLYRYFDADGRLLYVGITSRERTRQAQHATGARWWPLVAKATFEHYPTRELVQRMERHAIRTEDPLYNRSPGPYKPGTPMRDGGLS